MTLSGRQGPAGRDPAAVGPLHVTDVSPAGAAAAAGIKLGDEIVTVNDIPPYANGKLATGVLDWLSTPPIGTPVKITLHRPATDETLTVTLNPAAGRGTPPAVEAKLVDNTIAYVRFPSFGPGSADKALAAIADLRKTTQLRGVVLDLRGNGGGSPAEVARLTGALAHGKIINYSCDVRGKCTPNYTDDSVPLLNLPLVALTDRVCASACDAFSGAVKDLKLGTLVGTRTAGAVSGPARAFYLEDYSGLVLPGLHQVSANKQIINTIGVAPDHYAPMTAADLSAGRDPGLAKAVSLL
jgi:carboxyl-terminal processing protease